MPILFAPRLGFSHQELIARKEMTRWLETIAPWNAAVTLTFQRFNSFGHSFNELIGIQTLTHFKKILNQKCLGKSRMERGQSIGFAAVIGSGDYATSPHAHMCITTPPWVSFEDLIDIIEYAARRTDWINEHRRIVPYRDPGWLQYMTDHGTNNLVLELTSPLQTDKTG